MSQEIMTTGFGLPPTKAELVIPPEMHYKAKDEKATRGSIRCYPSLHLMNPFDAKPEDIHIEDIAHHLSIMNRYAGASPEPLSVAEHSVRVCRRVSLSGIAIHPNHVGVCADIKLAALLHDSEEAYLLDMPSPIKRNPHMHEYKVAASALRVVIFKRFDLDPGLVEVIKWADEEEYYRERREMWPVKSIDYVAPWGWREAERKFLALFEIIQDQRGKL
jgi:5'-deoxynucleotidase YfbR-like HD superfamily hydrolase